MNKIPEVVQVSPAYRHYEKRVYGHGVILPSNCRLKWYDITRGKQPIEQSIRELAQDFLVRQAATSGVPSAQELGFIFLHRCGSGFYFLGLCTWRGNNELWKTIYYFDAGKMDNFALFPQDKIHKDTFCVWELAVVAHETQAWTTYLLSDRTSRDADTYLATIMGLEDANKAKETQ